jgi:tetratricopeptide (TPR) repeat protein
VLCFRIALLPEKIAVNRPAKPVMPTIAEVLSNAMGQLRNGQLREAEAMFRQVLAADPQRAEAWHYLGVIAYQVGQYESAAQHIHRAVQLRPDYADAHNNLGLALQELGKPVDAAACYSRALEINPKSGSARFNLGNVLKEQGKLSDAAACYREALTLTPDHAETHNHLGIVLHDLGQSAEAVNCYRRALELNPRFVAAYINLGVALRDLGKLDEAAACYRRALEIQPGTSEAHLNLGNVLRQQQKLEEAVASYQQALELKPDHAETLVQLGLAFQDQKNLDGAIANYRAALAKKPDCDNALNNLGLALQAQRQIEEAIVCYQRALELSPAKHETHFNLGNAFKEQRKLEEAVACYERVLQLKPDHAKACNNLGIVLHDLQKLEEAASYYRKALELNPQFAEAYNNLGIDYKEQGKLDDAAACYLRAIALNPERAEVHNHLGTVLHAQGKWEEAVRQYGEALSRKADFADAHNNLSLLYQDQGQTAEALAGFRRAIDFDPDFAAVYTNLGNLLHQQGKLDEAAVNLDRAIELNPDSAEAHFNRSLVMLQRGNFENGWAEYEWLWKCKEFLGRALKRPTWNGSPLGGRKTVLLHTDQGLGDILQFVRYAALVKERAKKVVLRCEKRLIPLLSRCAGLDKLVPLDVKAPVSDAEAHLTSLPRAFNTTVATIPNLVPYLFADEELIKQWRGKLPQLGFKIGIAWQGNPKFKQDKTRSIPLAAFEPLTEVLGVRLISLQKVQGIQQIAEVRERFDVLELGPDVDEATGAFMDTAAVMMNLDLVVTSDTAIAHLAGGLGVRVWLALSAMPEWRWLLDRSDSPWYPTMRLFRQKSAGDWASVFQAMREELTALTAHCQPSAAEAHFLRGKAHKERGELEAAAAAFQQAVETQPAHAEALNYLGIIRYDQNQLGAAMDAYRRALICYPNYAEAHSNLGTALQQQGDLEGAIACFRRAVEIMPTFAGAFFNLGNAFHQQKKLSDAVAHYRQALQINPRFAEAHNNLGNVLQDECRWEEASACYRRAMELKPDYAAAHNNLGFALQQQRMVDEAGECYRRAIELKPDYAEAHFRYATWMLQQGDFEGGWREYEWLWKTKDFRTGALGRPSWDGSPVAGSKTLLLHADQGFGDTFQFIRFAGLVKPSARRVVLACAKKLIPLLSRCPWIDEVVPHGSPFPKFDAEAYLTSLPRALKTTLEDLPREVPYLFADSKLMEHWRKKLPDRPLRIGIAWQGNPKFLQDNTRSIPLAEFAPLAEVNCVQLISLQQDLGTEQLKTVKNRFEVLELGPEVDKSTGAFTDTAAIMMNLDLIVTSDTAIAHLAGGLGVPVWLALSYMPEWRWLLDRSDSPWYPTMRLFRQKAPGDWESVFQAMRAELQTQDFSER